MNRAKIFLILMFLLITYQANAQQYGWRVLSTPRPGYQMKAVEFKDSLHGWCTAGEFIYRTTDGGHTWETGSQPSLPNGFFDISFYDSLHGWAVGTFSGSEGLIWRTTDGGLTWSEKLHKNDRRYNGTAARGTAGNITAGSTFGISFPDIGILEETTNGGQLWTEQTHADSVTFLDKIEFIDSLHGWMNGGVYDPSTFSGNRSVFFRSTNGGTTWQLIDKPVGFFSFVDTLHGFAYGGRNTVGNNSGLFLLRTQDGGLSWDSTFIFDADVSPDQVFPETISFVDTLNGWLFGHTFFQGGLREIIIRTSDGGYTWTQESIGISYVLGDGMMIDKNHGWAVSYRGEVLGYGLMTGVVENLTEVPIGFILRQNYPNPFNNSTVIEYEIPQESDVHIAVYDATGKRITTLVDQPQEAGVYRVQFEATGLSSGIYFYTMQAGSYSNTKQLILLK